MLYTGKINFRAAPAAFSFGGPVMFKIRISYRGMVYRDSGRFDEVMARLRRWKGYSLRSFMQETEVSDDQS
jgi:hypothetical protein